MFDALKSLFSPEAAPETNIEGPVALGALLVEAAHRDGAYEQAERATILRILQQGQDLSDTEAATLLSQAEAEQQKAVDLFRFTHIIKATTPFEDRVRVIENLWEVILSDGGRDHAEDGMVRSVCGLLGVPDRESGLARARVQNEI